MNAIYMRHPDDPENSITLSPDGQCSRGLFYDGAKLSAHLAQDIVVELAKHPGKALTTRVGEHVTIGFQADGLVTWSGPLASSTLASFLELLGAAIKAEAERVGVRVEYPKAAAWMVLQ